MCADWLILLQRPVGNFIDTSMAVVDGLMKKETEMFVWEQPPIEGLQVILGTNISATTSGKTVVLCQSQARPSLKSSIITAALVL